MDSKKPKKEKPEGKSELETVPLLTNEKAIQEHQSNEDTTKTHQHSVPLDLYLYHNDKVNRQAAFVMIGSIMTAGVLCNVFTIILLMTDFFGFQQFSFIW